MTASNKENLHIEHIDVQNRTIHQIKLKRRAKKTNTSPVIRVYNQHYQRRWFVWLNAPTALRITITIMSSSESDIESDTTKYSSSCEWQWQPYSRKCCDFKFDDEDQHAPQFRSTTCKYSTKSTRYLFTLAHAELHENWKLERVQESNTTNEVSSAISKLCSFDQC